MTRVLVIGGMGKIGRHLVTASLNAGHPTAVLVRPATVTTDPAKACLLEAFKARGATVVWGAINEGEVLVAAIKQAGDVVISAVGYTSPEEVESQLMIVAAMKEAGNVKRFCLLNTGATWRSWSRSRAYILGAKLLVRQALRAAGIPHTIICNFWIQAFLVPLAGNPEANGSPDTTATIFGDGKAQVFLVHEEDMSRVAIRAVEDPRTLNKILHVRPPGNLCSLDQLVSLWEKKIGKPLHRHCVAEQELLRKAQESPFPLNLQLAVVHATFVAAGASRCLEKKNGEEDVDATQLYPDMSYVTIQERLDALHHNI